MSDPEDIRYCSIGHLMEWSLICNCSNWVVHVRGQRKVQHGSDIDIVAENMYWRYTAVLTLSAPKTI